MTLLDWLVLGGTLAFITGFGIYKGRQANSLQEYLLAGRRMRWYSVTLAIMATQASAITFLSTPGQGYADGMRFVQMYLGLPLAMIGIAAVAVPIYHRLKILTPYEYLEKRFDTKTRLLTAVLFLLQRGLATGLTIYAPSLVLSVLLGWNLSLTILVMGGLMITYTVTGGARAVSRTQPQQAAVIFLGMTAAFVVLIWRLPNDVSITGTLQLAGHLGRLNPIDWSFDLQNRYNIWSGLIGGLFLALSYFGTDHSQVQRYLTGRSVAESRTGLLMNGLLKVPMQFAILLLGALLFVFYQFNPAPLFFNPVETAKVVASERRGEWLELEGRHRQLLEERKRRALELARTADSEPSESAGAARQALAAADRAVDQTRTAAARLIQEVDPAANTNDVNYVFLTFVLHYLPAGLVGLILAVVFSASMSSTSGELAALSAVTVVDGHRRLTGGAAGERREVAVSRLATLAWGAFAMLFAEYAGRLGTLVEAVNILGSLFYGTILGIFLVAFFAKRVRGSAVFFAALVAEAAVIACWLFTPISFLWYNVVGCILVIGFALLLHSVDRLSLLKTGRTGQCC